MRDATWPAKIICQEFLKQSLCGEVGEILIRTSTVLKSSYQVGADNRPSIETHFGSFEVKSILIPYDKIVIIDDVLTLGRTSTAAVMKLKEQYPCKDISVFSVMRTRSMSDENIIVEPQIGNMRFSHRSGKVQMPD
jgi:predicted amidophosphoribosyltransferase